MPWCCNASRKTSEVVFFTFMHQTIYSYVIITCCNRIGSPGIGFDWLVVSSRRHAAASHEPISDRKWLGTFVLPWKLNLTFFSTLIYDCKYEFSLSKLQLVVLFLWAPRPFSTLVVHFEFFCSFVFFWLWINFQMSRWLIFGCSVGLFVTPNIYFFNGFDGSGVGVVVHRWVFMFLF